MLAGSGNFFCSSMNELTPLITSVSRPPMLPERSRIRQIIAFIGISPWLTISISCSRFESFKEPFLPIGVVDALTGYVKVGRLQLYADKGPLQVDAGDSGAT